MIIGVVGVIDEINTFADLHCSLRLSAHLTPRHSGNRRLRRIAVNDVFSDSERGIDFTHRLYRKIANPALNRLKRALASIVENITTTMTTIIGTKCVVSHNIEAVSRDGQIGRKMLKSPYREEVGFGRFLGSVSTPHIAF